MRNVPTESRRFNEGMALLGVHAGLLILGVLVQIVLATSLSDGVFAASYGFVLVYSYVVATTIGYVALAVRARQKPFAVRLRYLGLYHLAATFLMVSILLIVVYSQIAVRPGDDTPPAL